MYYNASIKFIEKRKVYMINKISYMNFRRDLQVLGFIVMLIVFNACDRKNDENIIVKAITVNSDMYGAADYSVEIFGDSTYRITDYSIKLDSNNLTLIDPKKNPTLLEKNTCHGQVSIKENVLFFDAACRNFNRAVLKNGYMDLYVDDSFVRRLLIKKASIPVPQYFDKSRFTDYAIFDSPKDVIFDQTYEIKQNDLLLIDSVLTSQLLRLKSYHVHGTYAKQLKVYANKDSVWIIVNLFPSEDVEANFHYQPLISFLKPTTFEGVYGELRINLTRHSFSGLHFQSAYN